MTAGVDGIPVCCTKEAERLAVLPRLVILDLAANPLVTACEDYRHLLLYRLRHLKVLDGVPAEAGELAAARAKYSGRLTMSFLVSGQELLLQQQQQAPWLQALISLVSTQGTQQLYLVLC